MVTLYDAIMAHGGDVDVWDDETGLCVAWVLDGPEDDMTRVLARIARETEIVSGGRTSVVADLWAWCEENWRRLERAGFESRVRIDGTESGVRNAMIFVQALASGNVPCKTYQHLAEEWGLTGASS
ncbi:MAG: hypothetical protein IKP53_08415 [Candidatus Methanomethylophilaceae archaeon]|nr:hypothetical protein [Candidatus Methanomethylophilaceae archaeon]